ncbi:MAG: hypothetical protein WBO36_14410, partial [Saprospiraceae bacterium]
MRIQIILTAVSILLTTVLSAQLPKTDIYLAEIKNITSKPQISSVKYLNDFNPNGYNNQAKFFGYEIIYFTAAIDTQTRTDVYKLDIGKNEVSRVTDTDDIS